jgi:hypothetical protein
MDRINFPGLSDQQVKEATGMSWQEWCELLDRQDRQAESLSAIVQYLVKDHQVRRLWAQIIAVYYRWDWCK